MQNFILRLKTFFLKKVKPRLTKKVLIISGIILVIVLVVIFKKGKEEETAVVTRGDIVRTVSVFGSLEHEKEARIGFATGGRVSVVSGSVGDKVQKGKLLVQIEAGSELARAASARADLVMKEAQKRSTTSTLSNLKAQYESIKLRSAQTVNSARKQLFSSGLVAYPTKDSGLSVVPPTISGTYTSEMEGEYRIKIYQSNADSGYSFELSGLESGGGVVSYENPVSLGNKGLLVSFDSSTNYGNTEWRIPVPNKQGATYATNLKIYDETQKAAEAAVLQAQDNYQTLAIKEDSSGSVSGAEIARSRASLNEAYAAVTGRSIIAPFSGTLARIDATVGEFVESGKSIVAVIFGKPIKVKVNIPQVDIVEVTKGMNATLSIEGSSKTYIAVVSSIDEVEQEIDGVPTYGATITITNPDEFLRSGMEVSAEIITTTKPNVLIIPFDSVYTDRDSVLLVRDGKKDKKPTDVILGTRSTDGNVEVISGLNEGDSVIRNVGTFNNKLDKQAKK